MGPHIATDSTLDPTEERLLAEGKPRRAMALVRRELAAELTMAITFVIAAAVLWSQASGTFDPGVAAMLALAYAVVMRVEFQVGTGYASPTQLVFVPMLLLLDPAYVPAVVAAGALLWKLPAVAAGSTPASRLLIVPGDAWYSVGPAVVLMLGGASGPDWADWPLYAGALTAQFAFDTSATAIREWLALGVAPRLQLGVMTQIMGADAMLAPIGLLAAFAAQDHPAVVLLVLPLALLLRLFARERNARLESAMELGQAYRGTAILLGDVVEADDAYTGEHSRGVVALAIAVGEELRLSDRARRELEFAALLHDVGKIAIPKEIINKPGKLTDEEFAIVKTHTIEGERLLRKVGGVLARVGMIVRSCHERWDGRGYPDGLAGEQIPLAARIIFACDAFNAMTTDRPYRAGRPVADALAELQACAGTQFDPRVVAVLVAVVHAHEARLAEHASATDQRDRQPAALAGAGAPAGT